MAGTPMVNTVVNIPRIKRVMIKDTTPQNT
jgi:hypothetical protein